MSIGTLLIYVFASTSILYIAHFGLYVIGACIYDIWQGVRIHRLERSGLTAFYRPRVTVLVPAHNEEAVIIRCMDSIFASTYPYISVIVVNDASHDATGRLLRAYRALHPDRQLRVITKRVNVGKGAGLNYALRRYVDSELVMMCDADSVIMPDAVANAVSYFVNPAVVGVAANVQIITQHTTLGILQKFEHMISYQSKKAYSIANCEYTIGGVASTYRTSIIRSVGYYDTDTMTEDISLSLKVAAKGNRAHRLIYAADVVAFTEPVETFSALLRQRFRWKYGALQNLVKHTDLIDINSPKYSTPLTMYRLPMAFISEVTLLVLPLVWLYGAYITLNERSLLLVVGAYLLISSYALVTLWYNTQLRWRERIQLTAYVPIMYFLFYIMDIIQIAAVIRCAVRSPQLFGRKRTVSTWVSPPRLGSRLGSIPLTTSLQATRKSHE